MTERIKNRRVILASASPRRREILGEMGIKFTVITADTDEQCDERDPAAFAMFLAEKKGQAVYRLLADRGESSDAFIISADTVVVCDGKILGKPRDRQDAIDMLSMLRDREHEVVTGIAVTVDGVSYSDASVTKVRVDEISDSDIEEYVDTKDPMDKAGAYGIQGGFSKWISGIDGCYFGVVGLPTNKMNRLIKKVEAIID
jgi:septum formation protein